MGSLIFSNLWIGVELGEVGGQKEERERELGLVCKIRKDYFFFKKNRLFGQEAMVLWVGTYLSVEGH